MASKQKIAWYHERKWAAAICLAALLGSYGMASLALNSGSLLQYFIAIVLLILSINRLIHLIVGVVRGSRA